MPEQNIELKSRELVIGTFRDRDTHEEREIVRIAFSVAIDQSFIAECREKGVKTKEKEDDSGGQDVDK